MDPPSYSNIRTEAEIRYVHAISQDQDNLIHHLRDDKVLIIRNADDQGNLMDTKLAKHHYTNKKPWVQIRIKDFKENKVTYEVPVCESCCPELIDCGEDQNYIDICKQMCIHSRVAGHIVRCFSNPMYLQNWLTLTADEDDGKEQKVEIFLRKESTRTTSQHLACVLDKDKVFLLNTTGRQMTPSCSGCHSPNCQHIRLWRKKLVEEDTQEKGVVTPDDDPKDNSLNNNRPVAHYLDRETQYGFNYKEIMFPFNRCENQKEILKSRSEPGYSFPTELFPPFDPEKTCKHNNYFTDSLKFATSTVSVFDERGEHIHDCNLFYRKTAGSCKCEQHYDGSDLMLYHISVGKFVDYVTLQSFLIQYVNCGTTCYGYHKSLSDNCKALGSSFNISYECFNRAADGFVYLLKFDIPEAFTCTNCHTSPKYFVGDGKQDCGPLQRKLKDLKVTEFGCHPDDNKVLKQGSMNSDRLFIQSKKERDFISSMLTGSISASDYLNECESVLTSTNSKLITNIINRFRDKEIPDCYNVFLSEATKNSPIAGLLQITNKRALTLIRDFCLHNINLRDVSNIESLRFVQSQLPVLWGMIVGICKYENSVFLPREVSRIILEFLNIRQNTFGKATPRTASDYVKYEKDVDPPTEFYPVHKLLTYGKLYEVSKQTDRDFCEKNFKSNKDFSEGVFSIGE